MLPLIYLADTYLIASMVTDLSILLGDGITAMVTEMFMAMATDTIVIGALLIMAQFMLDGILGTMDTHIITAMATDTTETIITAIIAITVEEV